MWSIYPRDVLEMNRIVYPDPDTQPLKDPRVRVHIDDGALFFADDAKPLRSHHQ